MLLRDYQEELIEKARDGFATGHKRVLLVAPCGAGKTVLAAYMASRHHGNVLFLAHRKELLDQTGRTFERFGLTDDNVKIESVQTAARHVERYSPSLIICDESHHCTSATWRKVLDNYPYARVVGLTATPCRLDGKGLDDVFDYMAKGIDTRALIEKGWLADYRYMKPPSKVDLSGVGTVRGDYDQKVIGEIMDKPAITGDALEHYWKYLNGKQAIVYCATISHSRNVAATFQWGGIPAAHLDGDTPPKERAEIVEKFRNREIMVLSNVDLLGEGFDVPDCDATIMLRPTQSTGLYIQQSMRCMRPAPGKTAVIMDHVDNVQRHGLPDDERDWQLKMKKRTQKPREKSPTTCPECFTTWYTPPFVCPVCGHRNEKAEREALEVLKGELEEIQKENERRERKREVRRARSYEDFLRIAHERGYKPGWAYIQARNRGYI